MLFVKTCADWAAGATVVVWKRTSVYVPSSCWLERRVAAGELLEQLGERRFDETLSEGRSYWSVFGYQCNHQQIHTLLRARLYSDLAQPRVSTILHIAKEMDGSPPRQLGSSRILGVFDLGRVTSFPIMLFSLRSLTDRNEARLLISLTILQLQSD